MPNYTGLIQTPTYLKFLCNNKSQDLTVRFAFLKDIEYIHTHTFLYLEPYHYSLLPQLHTLFELPSIEKIYILPQEHILTDGYTSALWFYPFALEIRGPINRGAWKRGGKTVVWQYNNRSKKFNAYLRDYSTHILTPTFRDYTNKLKLAMQDWKALPEEDKTYWRNKAKNKQLYGCNLYFKEWLKTH